MREILFRGKRYDGVWMEGGLFMHDPVRVCFSNEKKPAEPMIITDGFCDWGFEPPMLAAKVIPETVGQFTGLTDKNGKKIFEGDIVRYTNDDGTLAFYKVVWGDDFGSWMLEWINHSDKLCLRCMRELVEVIGNIHDNPELLEVPNG